MQEGNPYALAFIDIHMPPGLDGIETIKRIFALDPDIQIVICTAYSDYSWEETVNKIGETENLLLLKKPFDRFAVQQLSVTLTKKWLLAQKSRSYTQSLEKRIKESAQSVQKSLFTDELTGLPNRLFLNERIHNKILEKNSENFPFAILFFNLDRFKLINDSYGHDVGNELIKVVMQRIKDSIPEIDTLARLHGDGFVILTTSLKSSQSVDMIASKLLAVFAEQFKLVGKDINISASIGISLFLKDGKNTNDLLRNALMAMYYAKKLGGNQYQYYCTELSEKNLSRLEILTDLHSAIQNSEFFLCYQPQYNIVNNKCVSVEALIRWQHPVKGLILPINFIPIAEEIGLITKINSWVLKQACKQNKRWQEKGYLPIRMAVNITAHQFKLATFVDEIKNILEETDLNPEYLELELTENSMVNSNEATIKIVNLREMGIHIALDDFGMGYSNLNYLRKIPCDRLKIDQSFIKQLGTGGDDEIILQAIISMANALNLDVLAEGVETQKQLDFLKSVKCDAVQGYFYNQPLSADEIENSVLSKGVHNER